MYHGDNIKISVNDLFAFFVKKFWFFFIGSIVGMVLLLSYHYISSNSSKSIDEYERRLSNYKDKLSSLEGMMDNLELKLDFANEVESTSSIFSDGQIFVSKIILAVDSDTVTQVANSESGNNIVSYEIISFWNNLDLASIVGSDLDNDILKASITFEQFGQSVSISVFDEERNKAEKYASIIVDAFVSYFDARKHLDVGSKTITTSVASKSEIAKSREQFVSDKAELLKKIYDTEAEIKELKNEAPSKYHFFKNAVIGIFFGAIVVGITLFLSFVSRNPITSSFSVEKELGIQFVGNLFIDDRFFSKLARRIVGERLFRNKEESVEYLRSSFSSRTFKALDCKKPITILSSLKDSEVEKKAEEVKALLKDEGFESTFVDNSSENPLAINTIDSSEAVILLERQWISKAQFVYVNKNLVLKMDKIVLGFVLC